jgi:hypothetical protein
MARDEALNMRRRWIFIVPAAIAGIALFTAIGGEVVRRLWNWLMPALFGWPEVTFWQAVGLLALCRILFGGVAGRGGYRSGVRRRMRDRMGQRWAAMTPEERARFQHGMRGCRGFGPPASESRPGGTAE